MTAVEEDFTFVYGVTRDLTLAATLPILERRLRFHDPAGDRRTIPADGPGGLTLAGVYRLHRRYQMQHVAVPRGRGMGRLTGLRRLG